MGKHGCRCGSTVQRQGCGLAQEPARACWPTAPISGITLDAGYSDRLQPRRPRWKPHYSDDLARGFPTVRIVSIVSSNRTVAEPSRVGGIAKSAGALTMLTQNSENFAYPGSPPCNAREPAMARMAKHRGPPWPTIFRGLGDLSGAKQNSHSSSNVAIGAAAGSKCCAHRAPLCKLLVETILG